MFPERGMLRAQQSWLLHHRPQELPSAGHLPRPPRLVTGKTLEARGQCPGEGRTGGGNSFPAVFHLLCWLPIPSSASGLGGNSLWSVPPRPLLGHIRDFSGPGSPAHSTKQIPQHCHPVLTGSKASPLWPWGQRSAAWPQAWLICSWAAARARPPHHLWTGRSLGHPACPSPGCEIPKEAERDPCLPL